MYCTVTDCIGQTSYYCCFWYLVVTYFKTKPFLIVLLVFLFFDRLNNYSQNTLSLSSDYYMCVVEWSLCCISRVSHIPFKIMLKNKKNNKKNESGIHVLMVKRFSIFVRLWHSFCCNSFIFKYKINHIIINTVVNKGFKLSLDSFTYSRLSRKLLS